MSTTNQTNNRFAGCVIESSHDVTASFDRTKTYYRILRPDEAKYKLGLNNSSNTPADNTFWPVVCSEKMGGFYFTDIEHILYYLFDWGVEFCEVTVPETAIIYQEDPEHHFGDHIWRASEIILSNKNKINVRFVKDLIEKGAKMNKDIFDQISRTLNSDPRGFNVRELTEDEGNEIMDYLEELVIYLFIKYSK